jgi:hypothetical protein
VQFTQDAGRWDHQATRVPIGSAVLIDQLKRFRARQETAGGPRFAGVSECHHGPSLHRTFKRTCSFRECPP